MPREAPIHALRTRRNRAARLPALGCASLCGLALILSPALPAWAKNHWALAVTLVQNLAFTPVEQGLTATYVVAPLDPTAAIFDAAGQKNQFLTVTIVEPSIVMANGGGGSPQTEIPVDTWTFGGALTDLGGSGEGRITGAATLPNMRVGASAHVTLDDMPGAYTGTATCRVVYR